MSDPSAATEQIERWFVRRGIPHFIEHYDSTTRVWTRALPFLLTVYVLGVLPLDAGTVLTGLIQVVAAAVVLVGALVVSNWLRGNRLWALPEEVGAPELLLFLLAPTVPRLLVGAWGAALGVFVLYLVLMLLAFVVTSYGLVPLTRWALGRFVGVLRVSGVAAAQALPMLLLVVTFFFISAEVWQVFGALEGLPYGATLMLFVVAGFAFSASNVNAEVSNLESFDSWDEVEDASVGTPADGLEAGGTAVPSAPIRFRQRINLVLVGVTSQTLLAAAVAWIVGLFFGVFGLLAITPATMEAWTVLEPNVLFTLTVGSQELVLTEELIRVSGFLATFSGFYFAVYSIGNPTLREGLNDETEENFRELMAVRLRYLRHLGTLESPDSVDV